MAGVLRDGGIGVDEEVDAGEIVVAVGVGGGEGESRGGTGKRGGRGGGENGRPVQVEAAPGAGLDPTGAVALPVGDPEVDVLDGRSEGA